MKTNRFRPLPVLLVMSLMVAGAAQAEEEPQISDQQFCELEAESAGMMDAADIREYVQQCLDELEMKNEDDSESEHDSEDSDSSSR